MTNILVQSDRVEATLRGLLHFAFQSVPAFSVCIRSHPLLLAFVLLPLIGLAIGLIKRITRL